MKKYFITFDEVRVEADDEVDAIKKAQELIMKEPTIGSIDSFPID